MRALVLLLALLLAGCAMGPMVDPVPVPPGPVEPPWNPPPVPPIPPPVDPPVDPLPPPSANVVPFDVVQRIADGMTWDALVGLLGEPIEDPRDQRDGTFIARWRALDAQGGPRWLDVQTEDQHVIGKALWPRRE